MSGLVSVSFKERLARQAAAAWGLPVDDWQAFVPVVDVMLATMESTARHEQERAAAAWIGRKRQRPARVPRRTPRDDLAFAGRAGA